MEKENNLLKNTVIVAIGKICTQLITFLLLPIYTAVLTKEEYGVVDLLNTLIGLFLPIITLQIEQGIFRFLIESRDNNEEKVKIITSVFRFLILQTLLYVTIFLAISPFVKNIYKYFLVGNIVTAMFSSMMLQIARGIGDNKKYAIGSFITGALTVVINVVFVFFFHWGAYGMLGASLIANIVCFIYLFISMKLYKYLDSKKYDSSLLKSVLKYSIPLIPNMLSWWIVATSDRLIISAFLNIAQNGIYSAANKFSGIYTSIYNIFSLTWTESAAININSNDKESFFNNIFDNTIRIFGTLAIGIICVMPFIFPLLINEQFSESYYQIPILMLAGLFNIFVSFIGAIYVAKKNTKEIAKTSIFSAVINIVINIVFITKIGLYAASISTAVAYFIMLIYRYFDCKKYVKLVVNKNLMYSLIIMIIISFIAYYVNTLYLNIIMLTVFIIYAFFINTNSIKFIKNLIINKFKLYKQ